VDSRSATSNPHPKKRLDLFLLRDLSRPADVLDSLFTPMAAAMLFDIELGTAPLTHSSALPTGAPAVAFVAGATPT